MKTLYESILDANFADETNNKIESELERRRKLKECKQQMVDEIVTALNKEYIEEYGLHDIVLSKSIYGSIYTNSVIDENEDKYAVFGQSTKIKMLKTAYNVLNKICNKYNKLIKNYLVDYRGIPFILTNPTTIRNLQTVSVVVDKKVEGISKDDWLSPPLVKITMYEYPHHDEKYRPKVYVYPLTIMPEGFEPLKGIKVVNS